MVWPGSKEARTFDTGVSAEMLQKAGKGSVEVPAGFVRPCFLNLRAGYNWVCGHSSGDPSSITTARQESASELGQGRGYRLGHRRGTWLSRDITFVLIALDRRWHSGRSCSMDATFGSLDKMLVGEHLVIGTFSSL